MAHYEQHQKTNPTIGFLDFIYMHYIGNDGTTADDEEDRQLPFHQATAYSFGLLFNTIPSNTIIKHELIVFDKTGRTGAKLHQFNPISHHNIPLQPPRLNC